MSNLFYGIEIEYLPVKLILLQFIDHVKARVPRAEWTTPDKLHITLQFLGDVPFATAKSNLSKLSRFAPGGVTLTGLGTFNNTKGPRVLLSEVADHGHLLEGMRSELGAFGMYNPHVTLAKLDKKGDHAPEFRDIQREYTSNIPALSSVTKVNLYLAPGNKAPYEIVTSQLLHG